MNRPKKNTSTAYIENNQAYRQSLLAALTKLGDASTTKTAIEEIRDILASQVQDADRIALTLNIISETNEHQKAAMKKESLKIIGIMAEVFEDRIVEFLPKILALATKKIKENEPQLHGPLSDSIGSIIGFGLRNLDLDQSYKHISNALKSFYQLLSTGSKFTQIGASMCIAKIIQSSPVECLYYLIDEITFKLIELIKLPSCKAQLQLFECILSLILAVEDNVDKLGENAKALLPIVIDNMAHPDWNVRKIAVEVIYTLSVLVSDVLTPYKPEILDVLNHCRFDKIKNVRDIALTAINIIKDIPEPNEPERDIDFGRNLDTSDLQNRPSEASSRRKNDDLGKWGKTTSPNKKLLREKNPNFFNAQKNKVEIEIFTKSPPRNNNEEHEPIDPPYDPTIQIYTPYPIPIQGTGPTETQRSSRQFEVPIKESDSKKTSNREDSNRREQHYSPPMRISQDENTNTHKEVEPIFNNEEINHNHQNDGSHDHHDHQDQINSTHSEDFANIFKQLKKINKQQSKLIDSISTFQSTTQNEITHLKSRIAYLEDSVEKLTKIPPNINPYPYPQTIYPNYPEIYHQYPTQFNPPNYPPPYQQVPYGGYHQPYIPPPDFRQSYQSYPKQNTHERKNSENIQRSSGVIEQRGGDRKPTPSHHSKEKDPYNDYLQNQLSVYNQNSKTPTTWNKITEFLRNSQIRDAYELCLTEGDEETLLTLMKETGVVLDSLHPSVTDDMLNKLKSRLFDEINRHYILDWIERIILSNMELSRSTFISLHDVLVQVKENGVRLSSREEERITTIISKIVDILSEKTPQSKSEENTQDDEQDKPNDG